MVSVADIRAPLFVPADRPERYLKAAGSDADAVILDLEDAIAADAKDAARAMIRADFTDLPVLVRINPVGTPWHEADLAAARAGGFAGVILPKAEDAERTAAVRRALGTVALIALVETARGLSCVQGILETGVARLAFGSVDFCADLGCAHLREVLLPVRSQLVLASRLAGVPAPLDGVTVRIDDSSEAHDDALHARALGMSGKLCIHPRQVEAVLRTFQPTPDEIDWARRIISSGDGVAAIDGAMVDEPVRLRARAILASRPHEKPEAG